MVIDMDKLNAFIGQFVTDLGDTVGAGMVVIGERLGLYKALAEGPLTSGELAGKTQTDERYVPLGSQITSQVGTTDISRSVTPAARQNAVKRNFILQQGFEDPAPVVCPLQYSALVFQPKIVLIWVVAGILFQSQAVFAALCALLWWSVLFPKLNPFSALYNRTIGTRPGAFRLGPAPAPRRGAETEAGATALTIALLIHAGFVVAAYVVEAIFLAAGLAVATGGFCLGSFVYHLVRGHGRFALQTLPWAR